MARIPLDKGGMDMKQPSMSQAQRYVRPVSYGVLAGAVVCMLVLFITAVFMGMRDLPQSVIVGSAIIAFVAGGLVSGWVSASFAREKGMILGLCCGCCLFLILLLAHLMFDGGALTTQAIVKMVSVLLAAAIGGMIGVNRRRKFKTR